jgi:hypothetical protein
VARQIEVAVKVGCMHLYSEVKAIAGVAIYIKAAKAKQRKLDMQDLEVLDS